MAQIPTPPASRPGSEAPDVDAKSANEVKASVEEPAATPVDLAQYLDTLLEQYLVLLDQQQKLQSSLAEQLSSGFIALAQANFSSPGRRYGPDYYDERMKATRKILIQSDGNPEQDTTDLREDENLGALADSEYTFSVLSEPRHPEADANQTIQASDHVPSENPGVAEEPTSPEMTSPEPSDSETKTILPQKHKPRKKLRSDPIHWYGILVPPSLRRAQASFAQAIDHPIPDLASTTVQMRTLEQEISQVRVQLEIEASATT